MDATAGVTATSFTAGPRLFHTRSPSACKFSYIVLHVLNKPFATIVSSTHLHRLCGVVKYVNNVKKEVRDRNAIDAY